MPSDTALLSIEGVSVSSLPFRESKHKKDGEPGGNDRIIANKLINLEKRLRQLMIDKKWGGLSRGELRKRLRREDEDNKGVLDAEAFRRVLRSLDVPLLDDEIEV
jgi:hypothetical protein